MPVIASRVDVEGLTGRDVTEFMSACTDELYQGWRPGIGRVLDPLLRLYFTPGFTAALDAPVRTELPLLRDHLPTPRAPGAR